jgi:heat shock protein beta
VVQREEEAIKLDGLNVAQMKELRDKAEKFTFQTEVNRMMKLIINSLYRNKEVNLPAFCWQQRVTSFFIFRFS